MVSSIIIFALILVLCAVMPVFEHSREWGYKPAAGVAVVLLIVGALKFMGYI